MTFSIQHHENLLRFLFDSFLSCNVVKITSGIPMEGFSLNFKVFIFIRTFSVFCLRNKRSVVTVYKFCPKGSYWIKPCETLSFLVHLILFATWITFLLVKILALKSVNVSLFGPIFKYRITITFLFLTFEHERSFIKISYQNNPYNNDFNNFHVFLTILAVLVILRSVMPCVMWRPLIWHSMTASWLASAWCGFLLRGALKQTFILVLLLMLLLSVIWAALHEKRYFIIFYSNRWI